MSNVTNDFTENPKGFLEKYAVVVSNVAEVGGGNKIGVSTFYFIKESEQAASLKQVLFGSKTPSIKAYWLPWKKDGTVTLDLKGDADYFFTSQMSGCRFSLLSKDGEAPKVAHIAGTLTKTKRQAEEDKVVASMGGSASVRSRSLSVSGGATHQYRGQGSDPGSAFVYGVRDRQTGTWTLAAQIVGAAILQQTDARTLQAKIHPAFSF